MYKKILAVTFAVMFLSSVLSVGSTMTPAFAEKSNHHKIKLPKLSGQIPFGTSESFGFTFGTLNDISVNEDNHRVYAVANDTVYVIDGKTNSFIASIPVGLGAGSVAVDKETNKIYVANTGICCPFEATLNTVSVIDGKTNKVIDTIPIGHNNLFGISVNEKTNRVYATSFNDGTLLVVDGKTNRVMDDIPLSSQTYGVAASENSNRIYVANPYNSTLSVVDGKTDKVIDTVPFGTSTPSCFIEGTCIDLGTYPAIAKLDDTLGRIYVIGLGDGILYIFDTNTHHKIAEMHFGHHHK